MNEKKKLTENELITLAEKTSIQFARWKRDGKLPKGWIRTKYSIKPPHPIGE